jgi:hypothetical protein
MVIDARETFAARAVAPVKFPSFSPNLRYLQELSHGIVRTCTGMVPVRDFRDGPSDEMVTEVAAFLDRNVHGVNAEVVVRACVDGWLVVFDTTDCGSVFTFSYIVHRKWIVHEKSAPHMA